MGGYIYYGVVRGGGDAERLSFMCGRLDFYAQTTYLLCAENIYHLFHCVDAVLKLFAAVFHIAEEVETGAARTQEHGIVLVG